MINGVLRPWGSVQWLLQMKSLQGKSWLVIGAVSTQDRCLSILRHAGNSYSLGKAICLEIEDAPSSFSQLSAARRAANLLLIQQEILSGQREVHKFELFEPILRLKKLVNGWLKSGIATNVIFDVSALPEQYYFPMMRWLVGAPEVENLVVTYMAPEKYSHEDLAYNVKDWAQLPTFVAPGGSDPAIENVVVGVGFLPFSLPEWLKTTYVGQEIKVSLIFPFPSEPANVARGWEFVRRIEANMTLKDERQLARIDAHDMSGCFDRVKSITRDGKSPTVFAPYGPKAHSVAMCLQALTMSAEVFFTHPTFYHPEYSTGMKFLDAKPAGSAYAVRLHGQVLYE